MSKMTVRHQEYTPEGHCVVRFYEVDSLSSTWIKSEKGVPVDYGEGLFDSVYIDTLGHITSGHVMLLNSSGVKIWERGLSK